MFYYVKKPHHGRRRATYDIYRDNKPFLILSPGCFLFHREAREIASLLNRYYEDPEIGDVFRTPGRREDDKEKVPPP